MHESVFHNENAMQNMAIERHDQALNIMNPISVVVDYVLAGGPFNVGHRVALKLRGPRQVIAVKTLAVYIAQKLGTKSNRSPLCTADGMQWQFGQI